MKICIISPLFDPWLVGGAEKYAKTLVDKLSTKYKVVVITSRGPIPRQQNQFQQIEIDIRDQTAAPVHFKAGTTIALLHFRRHGYF